MAHHEIIEAFTAKFEAVGLPPPLHIIANGEIQRFSTNGKPRNTDGWYCLFLDGIAAGAFGCWRTGIKETWCARNPQRLTEAERSAYRQRIETIFAQREAEGRKRHAEAALRARVIWDNAKPATKSHHYLQRKGVRAYGLRVDRHGRLIIPVFINGTISSLQFIDKHGTKQFLSGSAIKGGSFTIGDLTHAATILVAEGYATAATLHDVTDLPVVIAFNAGNLESVAKQLRVNYPTVKIAIGADSDFHTDGKPNTGLLAAQAAAQAINGKLAIPSVLDNSPTDWNDVHCKLGSEAVKQQIGSALPRDEGDQTKDAEAKPEPKTPQANNGQERKSQSTRLIELADEAELWHTPDGDAYATIRVTDHREHHRLRSKLFKQWLGQQYYTHYKGAPSAQGVNDALAVLEAKACFDGEERPVHVRVAERNGVIYLDLANENWEAVAISPTGWTVIATPPIAFRRGRGMLALPIPHPDGSVERLRQYVNLDPKRAQDWTLLVACLLAMFRPKGPYPVIVVHGEQGSAKSTLVRILRILIDPHKSLLRTAPRDERDMMISASNSWVLAYDNLSHLDPWLSDAFCRLSTGGGLSTRELYSDADELILEAQRPILINGIEELATRGDLLDRAVLFYLPTIPKENRRTEADLWQHFAQDHPYILGALLDVVSKAMQELPSIKLESLPRLADFALWVASAEKALGWESGTFLKAYTANQTDANDLTLEASPITAPLKKWIVALPNSKHCWDGTASALLEHLNGQADDQTKRLKGWPKKPNGLSNTLRRLAPNLRVANIEVTFSRTNGVRSIKLEDKGQTPSSSSSSSLPDKKQEVSGDNAHDDDATHDDAMTQAHSHATSQFINGSADGADHDDQIPHPSDEEVVEL